MQAGLVPFTDDATVPNIVVPSLAAHTIPLEFFPDWANDAGQPAFGGAAVVSVWEDGGTEGVSTANVTGVLKQPIATVGGITLPTPDPAVVYRVRLRVRSAVTDTNYVDRVVVFRVVTPLMVPFGITEYAANQQPGITRNAGTGTWKFDAVAGTFPAGEIRLQDGLGGIVLPSAAAVDFPAEAKAYLEAQLGRLRESLFIIDFAPTTGIEATMRIVYRVVYDGLLNITTITKYRVKHFGNWGYFNSAEIDFINASVDMVAETASVEFVRGLYALGPRFQAVYALGSRGTVSIDPRAVQIGQEIDVSAAVDFDRRSHLSISGLQDKFLVLICVTDSRVYMREIPLRPKGWWDFVSEDGITGYNMARYTTPAGSQPLLSCRVLFGDYIEFPNLSNYYDPSTAYLPNVSTLPYPRVQNISIFADGGVTANVVYTDVIDMHNQMYSVRMPEIGHQRSVIDRRQLRQDATPFTAIPSTTAFLKITYDVVPNAVDPAYSVVAWHDLNWSGQPGSWTIPATVAAPDAPTLTWDQDTRALTIVIPGGSAISSSTFTLRGDLGSITDLNASVPLNNPGTTVISNTYVRLVATEMCEFLEVEYTVTAVGRFVRRIALGGVNRVIIGSAANILTAYFTGASLVLKSITPIVADGDGTKSITVVGDGPPLHLHDVAINVPIFLNFQGTTPLAAGVKQFWVDLVYMAGSPATLHRMRVYNTFFDARSATPRTLLMQPLAMHGWAGLDYELTNFSVARMKFDMSALTTTMEDDGLTYDFVAWRLENLRTGERCEFYGGPNVAVAYSVAPVLHQAVLGERLLLTVLHRSGREKTYTISIETTFTRPRVASLRENP